MKRTKKTTENTPTDSKNTPISQNRSNIVDIRSKTVRSGSGSKKATPVKRAGPTTKSRARVKEYAIEYKEQTGKWPTYKDIKSKCNVGETIISEVMKNLKGRKTG